MKVLTNALRRRGSTIWGKMNEKEIGYIMNDEIKFVMAMFYSQTGNKSNMRIESYKICNN